MLNKNSNARVYLGIYTYTFPGNKVAAKIQQMDMFLFHKSQYLLIYKVGFDVKKMRVNFLPVNVHP